jgi:predicted ATPase with chaperone activity
LFQKLPGFYQDMVVEFGLKVVTQALCTEVEPASTSIADLAGSESIQTAHLAEGLQHRPRLMDTG